MKPAVSQRRLLLFHIHLSFSVVFLDRVSALLNYLAGRIPAGHQVEEGKPQGACCMDPLTEMDRLDTRLP